jgi:cell division protein FtsB
MFASKVSGHGIIRKLGLLTGVATLGIYTFFFLRGEYGLGALGKKREEIRAIQTRNAELKREIDERRDRNRRLRENSEEQDLEIRKRLNMLQKGDKNFVVPETPKPPSR